VEIIDIILKAYNGAINKSLDTIDIKNTDDK
jgi:hypothetical protein